MKAPNLRRPDRASGRAAICQNTDRNRRRA